MPGRLQETRNELMNVVIGLFWKIQDGGTASGSVEEIAAAQPAEQAASFTPLVDLDPRIGNVEGKEMEKPKYIYCSLRYIIKNIFLSSILLLIY